VISVKNEKEEIYPGRVSKRSKEKGNLIFFVKESFAKEAF